MNYNFHPSLDDKVQRLINCMEPGTKVEIHHHPVDGMLIVIRGAIKAILVDDDKNVIDVKVIRPADGVYTSTCSAQVLCNCQRMSGTLSNAWSPIPASSR